MELSLRQIADLGLYLDDPYGDGIRLDIVRNPPEHRKAALDLVINGQLSFDSETLIRNAYEDKVNRCFDKNGNLILCIAINFSFDG